MPSGYGVFISGDKIHCGQVIDNLFGEGKRVSIDRSTKEMQLFYSKILADGTKLEKIEIFSQKVESKFKAFIGSIFGRKKLEAGFYRNGVKVAEVCQRLNAPNDGQDWLSLKPNHQNYFT